MTSKYEIVSNGRTVALAYVSPHPAWPGYMAASVWPMEHSGEWEKGTREIALGDLKTWMFASGTPESEIVKRLLVGAHIDPSKCNIAKVPLAGNGTA